MNTLYQIIKAAKAAKGSNAKKAVLEANKDHPLLAPFLKAVFDPAISYYITKVPKVTAGNMATMDGEFIEWLTTNIAGRKYTGKTASSKLAATLSCMDEEGIELASYIIKRKVGDGVGESMTLDVFPKLFFVPPYNRCAKMDEKVIAEYDELGWFYIQTKYDGQFGYLRVPRKGTQEPREGTATLFTRNGSFYPSWLAEKLSEGVLEGFVYMGELLVYQNGVLCDRKTGNGILNSILQGEGDAPPQDEVNVRLIAWDMVTEEEFENALSERPYTERLGVLLDTVGGTDILVAASKEVNSLKEAHRINAEMIANGEEGTVIKKPNGIWRDSSSGTRDCVKLKVKFTAEYLIFGYYEGKDQFEGSLGGFTIATPCGRITNNVGSGFTPGERHALWGIREQLRGLVVSVDANDIVTSKGKDTESLFLPIFVEIRYDRREADSYERVKEQLAAAKAVEKTTEGDD